MELRREFPGITGWNAEKLEEELEKLLNNIQINCRGNPEEFLEELNCEGITRGTMVDFPESI